MEELVIVGEELDFGDNGFEVKGKVFLTSEGLVFEDELRKERGERW